GRGAVVVSTKPRWGWRDDEWGDGQRQQIGWRDTCGGMDNVFPSGAGVLALIDELAVDTILNGVLVGKSIAVGAVPTQSKQTTPLYKAWVFDGETLGELVARGAHAVEMEQALSHIPSGSVVAISPVTASGNGYAFELRSRPRIRAEGNSSMAVPVKTLEVASQQANKSRVELGGRAHRCDASTGTCVKARRNIHLVSSDGQVVVVTMWGKAAAFHLDDAAYVRIMGASVDRGNSKFSLNDDGAVSVVIAVRETFFNM
ncbi:unnamed protein product, partial [Prorocentrum cordatum]